MPPQVGPCGRVAFELPLRPDGSVERERIRILLVEDAGGDPHALVGLRDMAAGSRWQMPERQGGDATRFAILQLDCTGRAGPDSSPAGAMFDANVERAGAARRQAAAALRHDAHQSWSEHDLDCLWSALAPLGRGPFLHDALELAPEVERAVRAAVASDGGVWVCRAARASHWGQFVFLDRRLAVLGSGRYWLGE